MIHSDELFLQQQEAEWLADMENTQDAKYAQQMEMEEQARTSLPVINLNTINSSDLVFQVQKSETEKELVNGTSFDMAQSIIASIIEGRVDPIEFAVKKKLVTDAMDMAMRDKEVKKLMIEKVEQYGKQGATALGAKITLGSTRKYQYENDPTWKSISDAMKEQKESLKAQEEKVKVATINNASLIDEKTGEIIASIVPAPETTFIKVSFSKRK